jgi:hypothetical protein
VYVHSHLSHSTANLLGLTFDVDRVKINVFLGALENALPVVPRGSRRGANRGQKPSVLARSHDVTKCTWPAHPNKLPNCASKIAS